MTPNPLKPTSPRISLARRILQSVFHALFGARPEEQLWARLSSRSFPSRHDTDTPDPKPQPLRRRHRPLVSRSARRRARRTPPIVPPTKRF